MTQRILTTCFFLLLAVAAKSQTPDFQYRGIDPTTDCKSVIEFKVVAPVAAAAYTWDFGDGKTGTGADVTNIYDLPGKYSVVLTPDGDASKAKTIEIVVQPFDVFYAVRDNVTKGAGTFEYQIGSPLFSASGTYTFSWAITGPNGYSVDPASDKFKFNHTFPESGVYNITFKVNSSFSCANTPVAIPVIVSDTIIVPNVFTPNGDNVNDVWSIKSNGKDKLSVKIYSRAGVLVYEEHAITIMWDGKTAYGKELVSGVYYYVVDRDDKLLPAQKGFFYLLRGK